MNGKPDLQEKCITMTGARMQEASKSILEAMNLAQKNGFTLDEVLMTTAYILGSAIAQRGGVLMLDEPLKNALPPLVDGYLKMRQHRSN